MKDIEIKITEVDFIKSYFDNLKEDVPSEMEDYLREHVAKAYQSAVKGVAQELKQKANIVGRTGKALNHIHRYEDIENGNSKGLMLVDFGYTKRSKKLNLKAVFTVRSDSTASDMKRFDYEGLQAVTKKDGWYGLNQKGQKDKGVFVWSGKSDKKGGWSHLTRSGTASRFGKLMMHMTLEERLKKKRSTRPSSFNLVEVDRNGIAKLKTRDLAKIVRTSVEKYFYKEMKNIETKLLDYVSKN